MSMMFEIGHDHPETSHEMAEKANRSNDTLRQDILDLLAQGPLTDDEMEILLDRSHQSVSSTRRNLVKAGLVEDSGTYGITRYGNRAIRWRLAKRFT